MSSSKLTLLFVTSSPFFPSGYGVQTNLLMRELEPYFNIILLDNAIKIPKADIIKNPYTLEQLFVFVRMICSTQQSEHVTVAKYILEKLSAYANTPGTAASVGAPHKIYLRNKKSDFGWDMLRDIFYAEKCDAVLLFRDIVLKVDIKDVLNDTHLLKNMFMWTPIDHHKISSFFDNDIIRTLMQKINIVSVSQHGNRALQTAKINPIACIYHSIDICGQRMFTADGLKRTRAEVRTRTLSNMNIHPDCFVVLMVMRFYGFNSRKMLDVNFRGVQNYHNTTNQQCHLIYKFTSDDISEVQTVSKIIDALGMKSYTTIIAQTQSSLAELYQTADVLLSCTGGEGFGVPIIEAQYNGCPVIATDCTAMSELVCNGALVQPVTYIMNIAMCGYAVTADKDICVALNGVARRTTACSTQLSLAGHLFVHTNFNATTIATQWRQLLLTSIVAKNDSVST